jgi:type IV pilus assembly protein PilB
VFNQFCFIHDVFLLLIFISFTDFRSLLKFKNITIRPMAYLVPNQEQLSDRLRLTCLLGITPHQKSDTPIGHLIPMSINYPNAHSAIEALDLTLRRAIECNASDVHFENHEEGLRIRYRIDGLLQWGPTPPHGVKDAVLSRLKVLASMDIAEKRLPQDGRFQYQHHGQTVDMRVSSLPTTRGEKLVVRLLHYAQERPSLATLGYTARDQALLHQILHQPHGLILMTGPTGSGKTLSLYSCLDVLNTPERNVSTVEDPVEIHLPGIHQVQINERAGLTFAASLRAMLRQDPDVLMVGEIRDSETAEIAIQAAQTGHLVLSTLHTNDAPSTLARLRHMGIASFNVAASVSLIIAQRLVRCLCPDCKTPLNASQRTAWQQSLSHDDVQVLSAHNLAHATLYGPVGCEACHHGYKGRVGLYQVMPVSPALQSLIVQEVDASILARQSAQEGTPTLRQAGWLKVLQGVTSIEEVLALTTHD